MAQACHSDSDSDEEDDPESDEDSELEDNLPVFPALASAPPPAGSDPEAPAAPPGPWGPRFCPASERFLRGFFLSDEATKCSNARNVEVFKVSKSISISSGFESLSAGSLCWMI